jgi:hypothetical protein
MTDTAAGRVITKFGGQSALAKLLDTAPSTVQYWMRTGIIPAKRQGQLLSLARERGVELYPGDFMNLEPQSSPGGAVVGALNTRKLRSAGVRAG